MKPSRRLLAAGLAAGLAFGLPERGEACSCGSLRLERSVLPADGTKGFPNNGTLRVFLTAFPEPLRAALAQEYRLVDATGAVVPIDARVVATRLDLRPVKPLQPQHRYTLEQLQAFDADGVRLDDTQRARAVAAAAPGLRRAWFPVVAFESSAGPAAARPPATIAVREATIEYRHGGGDCGPGVSLGVEFDPTPALLETDILELEVRATDMPPAIVDTRPSTQATYAGASDLDCDPDPVTISARGGVECRLVAVALDGARVGASPWTAPSGMRWFPLGADWHAHRQARRGVRLDVNVSAWLSAPVVAANAMVSAGPSACPKGLEVTSRVEMAPSGGPWMYQEQSLLVFDGRDGWTALTGGEDGSRTELRQVGSSGASKVIRAGLLGFPVAMAVGDGGPLVVSHAYESEARQSVILRALTPTGSLRWRTAVAPRGRGQRVAAGGGVVLVTWTGGNDILDPQLSWMLLRESDGVAIGGPVRSAHAATDPAVATWVDGHFLIAWRDESRDPAARGAVHVMTLSATGAAGAPLTVPSRSDGPIDVVTAGAHVGLVTQIGGRIDWSLLSATGDVVHPPVPVSTGVGGADNRKPRVTFRDGLFAVSWEASPTRAAFVAVVDESGAVSPAAELDPTHDASCPLVIAAPGHSFLATYTLGYQGHLMAATLRCRTTAATGAPQRLRVR